MAIQTQRLMTVADYLEWEERRKCKHEYVDGEIFEMTGGTGKHSMIKVNITASIHGKVNVPAFAVYNSDMRVRVGASRYVYPRSECCPWRGRV